MAQFTEYASTDGSAPTLTGQVGSLTTLLDAILVNGYGLKTGAGWTIAQTAANQRAYQMGSGATARKYLSIDDSGAQTAAAKEAYAFGYETVSSATAGTGPFPTTAQVSIGVPIRKSATADATTRVWHCFADDRTMHFFMQTGDTASTWLRFSFGEFFSLLPGDTYACCIEGRGTANSATTNSSTTESPSFCANASNAAVTTGLYIDRSYVGTGGSVAISRMGDMRWKSSLSNVGLGSLAFPNAAGSDVYVSPLYMYEGASGAVLRGYVRGLWDFGHVVTGLADLDTYAPASGDLSGRTFKFLKLNGAGGVWVLETSNTLDTL